MTTLLTRRSIPKIHGESFGSPLHFQRENFLDAIDPKLMEWATLRQREVIETVLTEGNISRAAKKLNIARSSVQDAIKSLKRRAAIQGYTPEDSAEFIQSPLVLKGKSTLYGPDGEVKMTWVKTKLNDELAAEAIQEWVAWLVQDAKGLAPVIAAPKYTNSDLLAVYPMGDPHFGMYAWGKETGSPFDLDIAERQTKAAIDRLVASAPPAEHALLLELGDFFHADNNTARTPQSGAQLDVDTRWQRVMQVGLRTMIYCIKAALTKHKHLTVRIVKGNHDPHSSVALALALDAFFSNEKRVTIDLSPNVYWFYRFGKVLIGATHGDTSKPDALPGIMATDRPQDWGLTEFRFFYHGHIHHDSVKEFPGCMIESFRTLAAKDAWHAAKGYRSGRDMKVIIHHRDLGEIERHRVGIEQIEGDEHGKS